MKMYLGSPITAFAAIISPLFIFLPLPFGISALFEELNVGAVILFLGCVLCAVTWGLYLKDISIQLYTWGCFQRNGVQIKTLFRKNNYIQYAKCHGCGIGYYTHGVLNSNIGTKIYFIFLSYDSFDEQYRAKINLWKPTKTRLKVKFRKELYEFLIQVLPKAQSRMLIQDYTRYQGTRGRFSCPHRKTE